MQLIFEHFHFIILHTCKPSAAINRCTKLTLIYNNLDAFSYESKW